MSAIQPVNDFMALKRQRSGGAPGTEEILGVWLRSELDKDLPAIGAGDSGRMARRDLSRRESLADRSEPPVGVSESFSLSGLWSLCWLDGRALRGAFGLQGRRMRILESLVSSATGPWAEVETEVFCPVFVPGEDAERLHGELRDGFPSLVADFWFVHDPKKGLTIAREDAV